ncbi:hypothetical protein LguiB_004204 [Lonicera macranthoides]
MEEILPRLPLNHFFDSDSFLNHGILSSQTLISLTPSSLIPTNTNSYAVHAMDYSVLMEGLGMMVPDSRREIKELSIHKHHRQCTNRTVGRLRLGGPAIRLAGSRAVEGLRLAQHWSHQTPGRTKSVEIEFFETLI